MSFIHRSGPALTEPFKKLASTAIAAGAVVALYSTGYLSQAVKESVRIAGVALKKIASADDDFAANTVVPIIVPSEDDIFEATVSGTAAQTNVGKQYDLTGNVNAGTAQDVDLAATTYKVVTVVGFISASKVLVKFNGNYAFANKAN